MASRWRCPPESTAGRRSPCRRGRAGRAGRGARVSAGLRFVPAIIAGSTTFSSTVMPSSRLKNWNTMPMWRRRIRASSSSVLPGDRLAGDDDLAVVGGVETGDEVEQRRLAAARGAHDRDELAGASVEVDAAQRAHRRELRLEGLAHAPHRQHRFVSQRSPPLVSADSDRLRYATTGVFPALHQLLLERLAVGAADASASAVASLSTVVPAGRARSWSRCARFTVSPTSVYSSRSSLPSSAAATSPVDRPMPSPNGSRPSASQPRSSVGLAAVHRRPRRQRAVGVVVLRERRAEHRHHRVADVLHDRAALVEDRACSSRPGAR